MPVADQPSILTVCLTAEEASSAKASIEDVLAARSEPMRITRTALVEQANSCDDSAYGMDISGIVSTPIASSPIGSTPVTSGTANRMQSVGPTTADASFAHASSGKEALELLRMLRFDLLVTSDNLPDMSVEQLVRRVRARSPWQKWALVGTDITTQDEITARTMGVTAVFDAPADWHALAEMAESIRDRAAIAVATATSNSMSKAGTSSRGIGTSSRGAGRLAGSRRISAKAVGMSGRSVG